MFVCMPNTIMYDLMAVHMLHLFPVLENFFFYILDAYYFHGFLVSEVQYVII